MHPGPDSHEAIVEHDQILVAAVEPHVVAFREHVHGPVVDVATERPLHSLAHSLDVHGEPPSDSTAERQACPDWPSHAHLEPILLYHDIV